MGYLWGIAVELQRANKFLEALELYTKILDNDPLDIMARNNRACAYDDLDRYKEALHDLNMVIALCPEYGDAYNNHGYINFKMKHYKQALDDYRISLKLKYPEYNPNKLIGLIHKNQLNKGIIILKYLLIFFRH
jgi:tetratricopeptide (TPR) repeat protein